MYEEKKVKIPFRDIALQFLIIILFVLILLWLFPTKKNMKKYVDKNQKNTETVEKQNSKDDNDVKVNNNKKTDNKNSNNKTNTTNNSKNTNNVVKETKQYEYSKTLEGTYGSYGDWSDWSTNYVASSDTVDVQTEVRGGQTGYRTYYVQNGTKTENNVVVGTKTNTKVLTGYDVKYIRDYKSSSVIENTNDYLYALKSAVISYLCADGNYVNVYYTSPKSPQIGTNSYEYIKSLHGDDANLKPDSTCLNAKVSTSEYNYSIYEIVPVYTSKTEDIYGSKTSPVLEQKTETTYGNSVTYYRYRTRSYHAGTESIKWSSSENDQNLLSQGYHFTGNVK